VGHRQDFRTQLTTRVDPRVILSSQLLELSQIELNSMIESELASNPALERLDGDEEPLTQESILRSIAPYELRPGSSDNEVFRSLPQGSEETDWLDFAPSFDSLQDHLRGQLFAQLPKKYYELVEFMTESIDDQGYLEISVEECALYCKASLDDAEYVLRMLQQSEPAGVGARSLQECLVLQIREETVEAQLARRILLERFEDLVSRDVRALARAFRAHPKLVETAIRMITSLNPYPGEGFAPHSGFSQHSHAKGVTPDLTFQRTEQGWAIEVKGADPVHFTVNRAYSERLKVLENKAGSDRDEKRHLQEHLDRANRFIDSLSHRKRTLIRIGEYLTQEQSGYLATGDLKFLRPMTRSHLAKAIGLHESAVSRATADKFVQLSTGDVVAFDLFFSPALRVQQVILEILATENPRSPLSDQKIADMLAERGIQVARRTVNKYRDRKKMLSSRRRKTA